jgi:predicted nucleic acid-binding protein
VLRASVSIDELVSSRLATTEMPRAVRRKAGTEATYRLAAGLLLAEIFLEELAMHPVEDAILRQAADLLDLHLGSLDAIHVATALALRPIAAFVTYDKRQADAARMVGLPVRSPGA